MARLAATSTLGLCAALGGCSSAPRDTLDPSEAAQWLAVTCGITLSAPPVLQKGTWVRAADSSLLGTRVEGIVVVAAADVPKVLETLRNSTVLNLRGASATRYSYQSPDERSAQRECELDTRTRELYFIYVK